MHPLLVAGEDDDDVVPVRLHLADERCDRRVRLYAVCLVDEEHTAFRLLERVLYDRACEETVHLDARLDHEGAALEHAGFLHDAREYLCDLGLARARVALECHVHRAALAAALLALTLGLAREDDVVYLLLDDRKSDHLLELLVSAHPVRVPGDAETLHTVYRVFLHKVLPYAPGIEALVCPQDVCLRVCACAAELFVDGVKELARL